MGTQIITILCEGPHDVAFIARILKASGFKSNETTKIGKYPKPFDQLLVNEASKTDIEQLNLTEVRRNLLPANSLNRDDVYIFLYSLEGDGKKEPRMRILKELRSFITEEGEIERLPIATSLSILYFFDADDKGIDRRLEEINSELREALPEIQEHPFKSNGDSFMVSKLKTGAFIFSDNTNDKGKLEDILVPLMRLGNEPNFDAAHHFLSSQYDDDRLFKLRLKIDANNAVVTESRSVKARDKEKYDEKKSLIGAVGQLQRSGKSNVVCISDCDFISLEKIRSNVKCQEITAFFNNFITP
jgi:hypothetical protein